MNAAVITGGDAPSRSRAMNAVRDAGLIIAVDSGLDTASSYGIMPDLVAGDFDSLVDMRLLERIEQRRIQRFPREKDETDTELGIRLAFEAGASRVTIVGGGGGRVDHLFAILALFEREPHPDAWVLPREYAEVVQGERAISGVIGEVVSFFPLGCDACRVRTTGLRWPLDSIDLVRGSVSVRNEFAATEVRLKTESGRLLMIREAE